MSEINELYQELIIDHSRNPRNFGKLENANHMKEGYNPLCGDKFTFYIFEKNGIIEAIKFEGSGCAISTASASLMTESLKGKTIDEADKLFKAFQRLVKGEEEVSEKLLGKLIILAGVRDFPMRVKCATLPWHTMKSALHDEGGKICTE